MAQVPTAQNIRYTPLLIGLSHAVHMPLETYIEFFHCEKVLNSLRYSIPKEEINQIYAARKNGYVYVKFEIIYAQT
jgi:hypothetical protein